MQITVRSQTSASCAARLMKLTKEQSIALSSKWLLEASENKTIKLAMAAAYAVNWSRRVKNEFVLNDDTCRPASWGQLAKRLNKNEKSFTRYNPEPESGSTETRTSFFLANTHVRYCVALALGVDESSLSPSLQEWTAESTRWLIRLAHPGEEEAFCCSTFRGYAAYIHARCPTPHDLELCPKAFQAYCEFGQGTERSDLQRQLLNLCTTLGRILTVELPTHD